VTCLRAVASRLSRFMEQFWSDVDRGLTAAAEKIWYG
jgi:hypothetical protein